jgi:hypothetical protein
MIGDVARTCAIYASGLTWLSFALPQRRFLHRIRAGEPVIPAAKRDGAQCTLAALFIARSS